MQFLVLRDKWSKNTQLDCFLQPIQFALHPAMILPFVIWETLAGFTALSTNVAFELCCHLTQYLQLWVSLHFVLVQAVRRFGLFSTEVTREAHSHKMYLNMTPHLPLLFFGHWLSTVPTIEHITYSCNKSFCLCVRLFYTRLHPWLRKVIWMWGRSSNNRLLLTIHYHTCVSVIFPLVVVQTFAGLASGSTNVAHECFDLRSI